MNPPALERQWKCWDHEYLWHPFTQMSEWMAEEPLVIERAEGNYLIDTEGKRYFDGISSLWCNVHGHGRPEIVEAISRQAAMVAHSTLLGLTNIPAAELSRRLIEIAPPGLQRIFYSDSGATAVEIALKMAFGYWQLRGEPSRDLFVSLTEGYHGDTVGAMSVGYSEPFDRLFRPLLFPCLKINPPHIYRYYRRESAEDALRHALEEAEQVLTRDRKRIAGGPRPRAATLATPEIFAAYLGEYEERKTFFHGHTFTGNPIACAAALASLELFQKESVISHVCELSAELERLLEPLSRLRHVADIRRWGLMAGIELV